jgi:porin
MDANVDFGLSDIGSDFVNSSFAMNPNIPLPTFPSQALGLATFFQLTDQLNIGSGVYDGTLADGPQGTQFGFNTLGHNGALSLLQLEYRSQTGPGGEHPGTVRLGGWHHSDKTVWTDFGDGTSTFNQNYGMWCNVDQMIWKESYGTDDDQGLSLFFLLGLAPGDRNSLSESYGYGLSYKGLIDCRDDDVIGAGVATVVFSREFRDFTFLDSGDVVRHSETAFEMFYKYKWSDYCTIQPDLQFIARPGGQFKDALLPGVRFQLVF